MMIIGQSTLDDLNSRLEIPLPMNRFRPAWFLPVAIHLMKIIGINFSMNNLSFAGVKLCKRCVLTTIDQATGVKGAEPLLTLSKYRRKDGGVYFGQNVIPIDLGEISIGDEIIVNTTRDRTL